MLKDTLFAHRGIYNNKNVPENSIKAFRLAILNKLAIELDVQIIKDNNLIIFHDNNLKRMTHKNIEIKDLTKNKLKSITLLNTKEKIPSLKETLTFIDGKVPILIELKETEKYKIIVNKTLKYLENYKGQIYIQSFSTKIIKYLKKKKSKYKYGLLISEVDYPIIFILTKLYDIDFLSIEKKLEHNKYIKKFKKDLLLWTIKDLNELEKFKIKKAGYICNNLPYD